MGKKRFDVNSKDSTQEESDNSLVKFSSLISSGQVLSDYIAHNVEDNHHWNVCINKPYCPRGEMSRR